MNRSYGDGDTPSVLAPVSSGQAIAAERQASGSAKSNLWRQPESLRFRGYQTPSITTSWLDRLMPAFVLAAAGLAAGQAYLQYLEAPETLWYSTIHDRHAHYDFGLNVGMDLRHGNLVHLVSELHRAQIWGILHGLLLGVVEALAGPDMRLAVLPSLAAWVGTALFGFLCARRLVPEMGNLAGLATTLFILASPAYQAFATDVMLESLGACLTLACLYYYLAVVQDGTAGAGRGLALSLTLLFLTKYNYWLLVAVGLPVGELFRNRIGVWNWLGGWRQQFLCPGWLGAEFRKPLNYLLAGASMVFLVGFSFEHGAHTADLANGSLPWRVTVYVAYLLFITRLFQWYRRGGRTWSALQPSVVRHLLAWHIVPILCWFVWPKRLASCIEYVTRNQGAEMHGLRAVSGFYYQSLAQDYHLGPASLAVAGLLLLVGCLTCRRFRAGGVGVVFCVLFIVAVNVQHHSKRSRFLHSWVATLWVVGGAGLAQAMARRWPGQMDRWRPAVASVGLTGLVLLQAPGLADRGFAPEGGCHPALPRALAVPKAYVGAVAEERHLALVSNMPMRFFLDWTYLEYSGGQRPPETTLRGLPYSSINQEKLEGWLGKAPLSALLHVEFQPRSLLYEDHPEHPYHNLAAMLSRQHIFHATQTWTFNELGVEVTLWKRNATDIAQR